MSATPRFTIHPDGRSLDRDRIYRAADGSLYCCEWSPTLNPELELPFADALALAQACTLDPDGGAWDAPEDFELQGALDRRHYRPAVPPELAQQVSAGFHWSKTQHASGSFFAWGVFFNGGGVYDYHQKSNGFVRAVRRVAVAPAQQASPGDSDDLTEATAANALLADTLTAATAHPATAGFGNGGW